MILKETKHIKPKIWNLFGNWDLEIGNLDETKKISARF